MIKWWSNAALRSGVQKMHDKKPLQMSSSVILVFQMPLPIGMKKKMKKNVRERGFSRLAEVQGVIFCSVMSDIGVSSERER